MTSHNLAGLSCTEPEIFIFFPQVDFICHTGEPPRFHCGLARAELLGLKLLQGWTAAYLVQVACMRSRRRRSQTVDEILYCAFFPFLPPPFFVDPALPSPPSLACRPHIPSAALSLSSAVKEAALTASLHLPHSLKLDKDAGLFFSFIIPNPTIFKDCSVYRLKFFSFSFFVCIFQLRIDVEDF